MHEFDKCNFCISRNDGICRDEFCSYRSDYSADVTKILNKADELNISVTDVLNLIRECNQ